MSGQGAGDAPAWGPGARQGQARLAAGRFARGLLLLIGAVGLITTLVKAFVVETFVIPSDSMANTVRVGDRVLVNRLVYHVRGIHRGDVIVFSGQGSWGPDQAPAANPVLRWYHDVLVTAGLSSSSRDYIKRVIGLPGDHVACCDADGSITVNGVPLREGGYLYPGERPSGEAFSVTVPPGRLWVMGDNRADSADSRDHGSTPGEGTIPESAVLGRAFVIIWPLSQWQTLPIPATFDQPRLGPRSVSGPRHNRRPASPALGSIR